MLGVPDEGRWSCRKRRGYLTSARLRHAATLGPAKRIETEQACTGERIPSQDRGRLFPQVVVISLPAAQSAADMAAPPEQWDFFGDVA